MACNRLRIASLNAHKLRLDSLSSPAWAARVTTIREIAPDILCVQEVVVDEAEPPSRWAREASAVIEQLAAESRLTATTLRTDGTPGPTAMASNIHRGWYTAIMWNPARVRQIPGRYRPFGAPDFWHGCTTMAFEIGTCQSFIVASYHGDPYRGGARMEEALRLKSVFRTTGGARPGVVVGDFNSVSSARILGSDGRPEYYDDEPYGHQDHDDLEYQLLPDTIGAEQLADRRASQVLLRRGYMIDSAAHLGVPWQATVGHWADGRGDPDPWGPRRIDLILATRPVAPALLSYHTHRSTAAEQASDHLPVICELDPSRIV
jgi:endonuclease/exonuclease/phosphatase family metal-dependent hydrolase